MGKIERNGIAVAGSVLVDKINEIKAYPKCGELAQITCIEKAIGKVGKDEDGIYVQEVLLKEGVDVKGITVDSNDRTTDINVAALKASVNQFTDVDKGITDLIPVAVEAVKQETIKKMKLFDSVGLYG